MTHICLTNYTIIGADNGLSHVPHNITIHVWPNVDLLLTAPFRKQIIAILYNKENGVENICNTAAILSRLQYVNVCFREQDMHVMALYRPLPQDRR